MRRSILIIEDDLVMLRGLTDNFKSRGFDVLTASDGEEAVQLATTGDADLILLDIMLPRVDGYEICRRVRAAGLQTPIVMLTAKGQENDVVRGLESGADDYVVKPFSIRELIARVDALLRRVTVSKPNQVCFGEFVLDLTAHVLTRAGNPIELTTKEFRLLRTFALKPFRAFTRGEILDRVWGDSVIVTNRSVDRCVTTLRAKIETDPKSPQLIKTIRDVGYRFELPPG